jgi:hypothetical protein
MEKKYCIFYCKNVNLFSRKYIPRIGANVKNKANPIPLIESTLAYTETQGNRLYLILRLSGIDFSL